MKRILLLMPVLAAALLAPAPGASARIVELGATAEPANPSCPADPCVAVVRVTGYQGHARGGPKNPYYIRRDGYIVAFTVTLSAPSAEQATFFNDNYGSPAQVQLSVLRKGQTRKTRLEHRLVQQTEPFPVDSYFGSSPTFALEEPLRVKEGNWIALTVPTWAPMLAINLTGSDWWRSSRARRNCEPPRSLRQFAMEDLRQINVFGCTYSGARMLYTATYIPDNRPTVETEAP
jgi:hypothetical protein